jgi:hypothetical protein
MNILKRLSPMTALMTTVMAVILSGCAQHPSIIAGDKFIAEGRYEQAATHYRSVMRAEPDDEKSRLKLQQAEQKHHDFLAMLMQEAKQMDKQERHGMALLLYGKAVSNDTSLPEYQRYQQLRSTILNQYKFKLKLNHNQDIFGHPAQAIIKVPANAKKTISDKALIDKLYQAAKSQGEAVLAQYTDNYRSTILAKSQQSPNQSDKLEYWVGYGLTGSSADLSPTVSSNVNDHLTTQYGNTVTFSMNELLFRQY